MTITQIKYFLAIIEYGGFSVAAEEMYISQSSLSKQIKSLEGELGTELFVRAKHKVTLSPGGELFLKHAKAIDESYEIMNKEMNQFLNREGTLTISLGVLPLMQDYHITRQLSVFQKNRQNVQINITEADQKDILDRLDSQKLDLAILRLDYLDSDRYEFLPIREDTLVFVCSKKQSKYLKRVPITMDTLSDFPLVMLNAESDITKLCNEQFAKANFTPNISLTAGRHLYLLSLVADDLGVTVLPKDMVNTRAFPNLTCYPLDKTITTRIGIVRLKNQKHTHLADLLYNFFSDTGLMPITDNTE